MYLFMGIVFLAFGLVIIAAGLYTVLKKNPILLSGYGEMKPEEKAKYNWDKISVFLGTAMIMAGVIFGGVGAVFLLPNVPPSLKYACCWIGAALFVAIIVVALVYVNKSKRFLK